MTVCDAGAVVASPAVAAVADAVTLLASEELAGGLVAASGPSGGRCTGPCPG